MILSRKRPPQKDVLEYYDQPTRIQLRYRAASGHKTSPWHTPDFLVIRQDGVAFEEWKPAEFLEEAAGRMPERYQREPGGGWRCPPGEAAAATLGLTYRVRTSNAYHPSYIQNLKFLQDFWTHPFTLSQQAERQVLDAVNAYPGVSVTALTSAHPDLIVDVVWAMLTTQSIFTDFTATSLMNWEEVFLYPTAKELEATRRPVTNDPPLPTIASPLLMDGRLWEAEMQEGQVLLRPEVGASFSVICQKF